MKIFKFIFLLFVLFSFSACEDLSFNEDDFISPEINPVQETSTPKAEKKEAPKVAENSEQILEEETTIISEDFELSEKLVIQDKKVVLDMIQIQTNEHDLTIIAEEFLSNHSIIRNFQEEQTAEKKQEGKSGGHVLIKAKKAKGSLGLILSGENGGSVSRRLISRSERAKLSGPEGENGYDAVYDKWCQDFYIPLGLGVFGGKIVLDRNCWFECRVNPTRGGNGEEGRQGYPGYEGKRGGDSGSFYLQAFHLSEFHLIEVKKTVGLGSRGGKGSAGGYGGERGKNGRDRKGLCSANLPRPKRGRKGDRGQRGKAGENGKKGAVCLEYLNNQQAQSNIKITQNSLVNNNQLKKEKIEIKCDESGIMCREVLVESNPAETLKKGSVVCY